MARLIEPGGSNLEVKPVSKRFTLKEMYDLVDCSIVEFVYLDDGRIMVIDEDGKINNKTMNSEATKAVKHNLFPGDYIVGNALLCDPNEVD